MTVWDTAVWIRVHWFELAALALLLVNVWFAFGILNVLRAMHEALLVLRSRSGDESTRDGPTSTPIPGRVNPLLINITLAALSWALLVLIVLAIWAIL